MICIFCKETTKKSKSIEHIIPESLGNTKLVLAAGTVCDKCNNYFSNHIEKPFFELEAIKILRFNQSIPSKRKKIPTAKAILLPDIEVTVRKSIKNGEIVSSLDVPTGIFDEIVNQETSILVFKKEEPIITSIIVSRFIGKIALELLAHRLCDSPGGLEYLANEEQFDLLRNHVRRGTTKDWHVNIRRIYDADKSWGEEAVQVIYECDILITKSSEYYFVLGLFGLEFVINYGGPELDGYERWLEENNHFSPLHIGKNNTDFK